MTFRPFALIAAISIVLKTAEWMAISLELRGLPPIVCAGDGDIATFQCRHHLH
ncbi:MAG: hypothetical protein WDN46_09390 [Methylocella sp.]